MSTLIAAIHLPPSAQSLLQPSFRCHPERSEGPRRSISAIAVRRFLPQAQKPFHHGLQSPALLPRKRYRSRKPSVASLPQTRRRPSLRLFLRFFLSFSRLFLILLLLLLVRLHRLGRVTLRRMRMIRVRTANRRDRKPQPQNQKHRTAHPLHRHSPAKRTHAGFYNEARLPDKINP